MTTSSIPAASVTNAEPRGQLCIWTAVDPEHDADFNRWYDREHMQERVAIPGFQAARRFRALDACPRPYLALYDTDNLAVFRSAPYQRAFSQQTEWSLRNFDRMRGTQRRVGKLAIELGDGEGGALALFAMPAPQRPLDGLRPQLLRALDHDGVIRIALLQTDAVLSTPLTSNAIAPQADALLTVEATRPEIAHSQALALSSSFGLPANAVFVFQTLWRLSARVPTAKD